MTGQSEDALRAARHNYAVLLSKHRASFDRAVNYWEQNGDYLPSQFSLAQGLAKNGETAKAIGRYRHILTLVPKSISARLELVRLMKQTLSPAADVIKVLVD